MATKGSQLVLLSIQILSLLANGAFSAHSNSGDHIEVTPSVDFGTAVLSVTEFPETVAASTEPSPLLDTSLFTPPAITTMLPSVSETPAPTSPLSSSTMASSATFSFSISSSIVISSSAPITSAPFSPSPSPPPPPSSSTPSDISVSSFTPSPSPSSPASSSVLQPSSTTTNPGTMAPTSLGLPAIVGIVVAAVVVVILFAVIIVMALVVCHFVVNRKGHYATKEDDIRETSLLKHNASLRSMKNTYSKQETEYYL